MRSLHPRRGGLRSTAGVLALAAAVGGCKAPVEQRAEADRDAYRALHARAREVPEIRGTLDVEEAERAARPLRGPGRHRIDLEEALRLAALGSREYRQQREDAFLAALRYTGVRHDYESLWGGGGSAGTSIDGDGASVSGGADGSLSRSLEQGGSFVAKLATTFLRTFSTDPVRTAQTILSSEFVLPLVRGSGTAAREPLTQAERDVLYALRSYARFQQEFVVEVASAFYRIVEARDTVGNEELTYKNLVQLYDRSKAFGPEGAGRMPDFEVDQARQNVLRADQRRIAAREAYERAVDNLRDVLGLPASAEVEVAENALDSLRAAGLEAPQGDLAAWTATALGRRLDLKNARDQREDADRKVVVAENGLGPDVQLRLGADLTGPSDRPFDLRAFEAKARAALDLDLPLDRVEERNAYRAAILQAVRAHRAVERAEDQIEIAIRADWRALELARASYRIQEEGVRLAERRVESVALNLQAGNATVRDQLEAEGALIEARNALTQSLVGHAIARLDLARDAGTLDPTALFPSTASPSGAPAAPGAVAPPPAGPAVPAGALPPQAPAAK